MLNNILCVQTSKPNFALNCAFSACNCASLLSLLLEGGKTSAVSWVGVLALQEVCGQGSSSGALGGVRVQEGLQHLNQSRAVVLG